MTDGVLSVSLAATEEREEVMLTGCRKEIVPNNSDKVIIVYCAQCDQPVQMGNHRVLFCDNCKIWANSDNPPPTHTLCCAECEKPLRVTMGEGSYCIHCGYPPSMQDTVLVERQPLGK